MKRAEMLRVLVEAAQQVPPNAKLEHALKAARKVARVTSLPAKREDYGLLLGNTARALDCIADGLKWAGEMRAKGTPVASLMPAVMENNRRAARLLEIQ